MLELSTVYVLLNYVIDKLVWTAKVIVGDYYQYTPN